MKIFVKNKILLLKNQVNSEILEQLRTKSTFWNPDYDKARFVLGQINPNVEKFIKTFWENEKYFLLPRGKITLVTELLTKSNIKFNIIDLTIANNLEQALSFKKPLYNFQQNASELLVLQSEIGMILGPTACGKTLVGLSLIEKKKQRALIIVHTSILLKQWLQKIEEFTNFKKSNIGILGIGKYNVKPISIGMIQTLIRLSKEEINKIGSYFGMIIVDECHRIAAPETFKFLNLLPQRYKYGLTATRERKDGKMFLLEEVLSKKKVEITHDEVKKERNIIIPTVIISKTPFKDNNEFFTDWNDILNRVTTDQKRNNFIINLIAKDLEKGLPILVLSERVAHCKLIYSMLQNANINAYLIYGETKEKEREEIKEKFEEGKVSVLVATRSLIAEGTDLPALGIVYLVTPLNNQPLLEQIIGRVCRPFPGKVKAFFRDLDDGYGYLGRILKKRIFFYKKRGFPIVLEK